jgi:hypothetical protein
VKLVPQSSAPAPQREAARGARGGGREGAVSEREQDGVEWRRRAVEKVHVGAGGGTTQRPAELRRDRRPTGEEGEAGASML